MEFSIFGNADINVWVNALGYFGIALIIFAETGLFFCFFLPGDSLLFAAGMLAAAHIFDIAILIPLLIVMSFLGYLLGYWVGNYFGHALLKHGDHWYFKKQYTENAHQFMQK